MVPVPLFWAYPGRTNTKRALGLYECHQSALSVTPSTAVRRISSGPDFSRGFSARSAGPKDALDANGLARAQYIPPKAKSASKVPRPLFRILFTTDRRPSELQ